MRKLAYLAIFLLIAIVIIVTLGLTNYAGIGDTLGGFMHGTVLSPIRNFIVNSWLFIGSSGWYILAAVVGIGMVWIPFYYVVIKGLFWNRIIQQKMLHRAASSAPAYQSAPSDTIPITGLQSSPSQQNAPSEPKPKEE